MPGFTKMTLSAGEAIAYRILLCDGAGNPEPYDPTRVFVTSISNLARADMLEVPAKKYVAPDGKTWLEWIITGRESEKRYGKSNLRFEIAERLSGGSKEVLEEGEIEIRYSAPSVENYPAAPETRHIVEVKRSFDPSTMTTPTYDFDPVYYKAPEGEVPPVIEEPLGDPSAFDMSDTRNSGYVALL